MNTSYLLKKIKKNNFLIIGRAGIDIYPDPPGTKIENAYKFVSHLGGSSANIAVALTKLGGYCKILTSVSNDALGRMAINQLNDYKVDTSLISFKKNESPDLLTKKSDLQGRTPKQVDYLKNIQSNDINFGIGPAGTGKTYLAVASAVDALNREKVKRIVLVRPAVEAGERLGFLPGDLAQKVDPYLRPLYDALYDLAGYDNVTKLFEKGILEVAPLAYMRGRTLNQSFIILDEAQNTTPEQMKMFLTRIGFGTKAVVTGDVTQIDLAKNQKSGLIEIQKILQNIKGITFSQFKSEDVVRHPLVKKIVNAYEKYQEQDS